MSEKTTKTCLSEQKWHWYYQIRASNPTNPTNSDKWPWIWAFTEMALYFRSLPVFYLFVVTEPQGLVKVYFPIRRNHLRSETVDPLEERIRFELNKFLSHFRFSSLKAGDMSSLGEKKDYAWLFQYVLQGLVNVLIEHHPTMRILSSTTWKWCSKSQKLTFTNPCVTMLVTCCLLEIEWLNLSRFWDA